MKFVDLLLLSEEEVTSLSDLLYRHRSNIDYVKHLPADWDIRIIQHAGFSQLSKQNNLTFEIIKSKNFRWSFHLSLFYSLRKQKPDVVLVHSMIYAWQILIMRLIIGSKPKIMVQNHAEKPFGLKRRWIQKLADPFISIYLFVSKDQALPWIEKGIISNKSKVVEMMEGSSTFKVKDRQALKAHFKGLNQIIFLWVGRLDQNKDPLTILKAFNGLVAKRKDVKLWMIYNAYDLLAEVKSFIKEKQLEDHIELIGAKPHAEMENFYNAADYFILGSHYEGSGYALCEAMACACVPIVTKIPSFKHMLDDGKLGHLFTPGNDEELLSVLVKLKHELHEDESKKIVEKFGSDLSFEAIASKIKQTCEALIKK